MGRMKSIHTVLLVGLALLGSAGVVRADRILVYNGALISHNVQGGPPEVQHDYVLFDLDTYVNDDIEYDSAKKIFTSGTDSQTAFNYGVVSQSGQRSQMVISYVTLTSNTNSHAFQYGSLLFAGETSLQDLGGNFTGKVPKTLSASGIFLLTSGAPAGDTPELFRETLAGSLKLVLPLTRMVNEDDDSLDDAVSAVEEYLTDRKYTEGNFD